MNATAYFQHIRTLIIIPTVLLIISCSPKIYPESILAKTSDTTIITEREYIRDTVHIALPRPQTTDTIGSVTIPVTAPALPDRHTGTLHTDTLHITDTIYTYIRLPLEQRYYTGPQYEAWVSGHRPRLDSLHIRTQTLHLASNTTVTQAATTTARPPKPGRWGIGIHLGYGMAITPQPQLRPYIGIGISYNIITF